MFNRPCLAKGLFYKHQFIHSFLSSFCSETSRHCLSENVRARELKLLKNVHPPNISHFTCHMSCVRCQVSGVTFFLQSV